MFGCVKIYNMILLVFMFLLCIHMHVCTGALCVVEACGKWKKLGNCY